MKAMDKFRTSLKKSSSEKQNLIEEQNNGYGTKSPTRTRSRPSSSSSVSSINSVNSGTPMLKIRAGTTAPSSPYDKTASISIDFDQVPFRFYSKSNNNAYEAYLQTIMLTLACVFAPFIFVIIAFVINEIRLKNARRMQSTEKWSIRKFFIVFLVIVIIKDLVIITIIIHTVYKSQASNIEVGYAPVVFLWSLFLFGVPLLFFRYSCSKYIFGDDPTSQGIKSALPFLTSRTQIIEEKKMQEQELRFCAQFKSLSAISGPADERTFIINSTSKPLQVISAVLAIIAILIHAFVPLYEQTKHHPVFFHETNKTIFLNLTMENGTLYNKTIYAIVNETNHFASAIYYTVLTLSAVNSITTSFLAALNFLFVILWKMAILAEWKRFNKNERNKDTTLVNSGPQGIAMWWKILQGLKLYTSSPKCMSVMMTNIVSLVCAVLIVFISMPLFFITKESSHDVRLTVCIFLLNNICLYIGLIILTVLVTLCRRQVHEAYTLIRLKQLNIGYELGLLMALEQDTIENEPSVRIKLRSMRGCIMLLQELTALLSSTKDGTSDNLVQFCFILSTALVVPSTFIGSRYLLLNPT